jgi:hypothetical protein
MLEPKLTTNFNPSPPTSPLVPVDAYGLTARYRFAANSLISFMKFSDL